MSRPLDHARNFHLLRLGGVAAILASLLALASAFGPQPVRSDRQGEPVFPALARDFETLDRVEVSLPDDRYTLAREGETWVLAESGRHPVRPEAIAALVDGLATLAFDAERTSDPAKLDRLGLGTPEEGGSGARLTLYAGDGSVIATTLAGRRRERTYVRLEGQTRAWRTLGDLPPLYARSSWLDLEAARIDEERISAVSVTRLDGEGSYTLARTGAERFAPAGASEGRQAVSRFAPLGPALALSRFSPLDVRRTEELSLVPLARHVTTLDNGLVVTVEAGRDAQGQGWVTVAASGEARRAEALNRRTAGWAYRLAPLDFSDFTAPESAVLRPVAQP